MSAGLVTFISLVAVSFLSALLITPATIIFARRAGFVETPRAGSIHEVAVPYLGGLALFVSLLIGFLFVINRYPFLWDSRYLAILCGATVIVLLGSYDDIRESPPSVKLCVQILVGLLMYYWGLRIETITVPLGSTISLGWLGIPVTVIWVTAMVNAINLIDGLDGLASGIVFIASASMLSVGLRHGHVETCLITSILAGSSLGFLVYNFPPAKAFLGDMGAMLMGFLLAAIALLGSRKGTTAVALLVPITALGVPVLDLLLAIIRRVLTGKSILEGDTQHLHHRLLRIGLTHREAVLLVYSVCLYLGIVSYLLSVAPRQYVVLIFVVLAVGALIAVYILRFVERRILGIRNL